MGFTSCLGVFVKVRAECLLLISTCVESHSALEVMMSLFAFKSLWSLRENRSAEQMFEIQIKTQR